MNKLELKIIFILLAVFAVNSLAHAAEPAKAAASKKPKVISYNLKANSNKPIPKLSIPAENPVELKGFEASKSISGLQLKIQPKIASPDKHKAVIKVQIASPNQRAFLSEKALLQVPLWKDFKDVRDPQLKESSVTAKKISELTPEEYRLVQATILYEIHHQSELVMPMVADLLSHKSLQHEARFLYSESALALGFHTEYRFEMLKLANTESAGLFAKLASRSLLKNSTVLLTPDVPQLEKLASRDEIETSTIEPYQIMRAKYFLEQGTLGETEYSLSQIPEISPYQGEAKLVSGLYNYRRGQPDKALEDLKLAIENSKISQANKDIAAITKARILFQKQMFKEAADAFLTVNKNSPYWLQAMIEQAWTQILLKDFEGAAGNMYTLHTDYFKNAYAPESYLVRTVSYLNLCQYGDGMATLNNLKHKYGPTLEKTNTYLSQAKDNNKYYDTIKSMLKNPKERETDGLPRAFIIELARHPSFMKTQSRINQLEDEVEKIEASNKLLATLEKSISNQADKNKNLKIWIPLIQKAKSNIAGIHASIAKRIEPEKNELRKIASVSLKNRFQEMKKALEKTLEQTDVLQYELLSGAGENMRYQMAGGTGSQDKNAQKVDKDKATQWSFKGEVWEDEIGHFKSGLKNICSEQ